MAESLVITDAHPLAVQYVDGLQKKNAESLSFYPRQVFEREIERRRILIALLNGEPCGYIYFGSGATGTMRCHQVCIQYDARRKLYGAALVVAVEQRAIDCGADILSLRCGFDLDANKFWKELGYLCQRIDDGGVRRMRKINVWQKALSPILFALDGIDPAVGKTSAKIWQKHKQTGIVTQFVRGAAMRGYRAEVIQSARQQATGDQKP